MIRSLVEKGIRALEYILVLSIILECNSFYCHVVSDYPTDIHATLYSLSLTVLIVIILSYVLIHREYLTDLWKDRLYVFLFVFDIVFLIFNVLPLNNSNTLNNYVLNFVLFLPLMRLLFQIHQKEGNGRYLFYIHSNIISAYSAINLLVYFVSNYRLNAIPADALYSRWSHIGRMMLRANFLNVCCISPGAAWQIVGINLPRNYGVFTEPLMFSIPLVTALFTELFIRKGKRIDRLFRSFLISAALLTAQSTIGMLLLAGAWSLKFVAELYLRHKKLLILPVMIFLIGIAAFVIDSKQSLSYESTEVTGSSTNDHIEDYKYGIKAFLHKPIFGGGYYNEEYIQSFMTESRYNRNKGFSNSIAIVFGEGGLFMGVFCLLPFAVLMIQAKKKKEAELTLWALGPFALYITVIFYFHLFHIMLLAFGFSYVRLDKKDKSKSVQLRLVTDEQRSMIACDTAVRNGQIITVKAVAIMLGSVLTAMTLIFYGDRLWSLLYFFLKTNQLFISQSPLGAIILCVCVLLNGLIISDVLTNKASPMYGVFTFAFNGIYIWLYPWLYNIINQLLTTINLWGEKREVYLLAALYIIPLASLTVLFETEGGTQKCKLRIAALAATGICALSVISSFLYINSSHDMDSARVSVETVQLLADNASGSVYADNNGLLYKHIDPRISLSGAKGRGFSAYDNATIMFEWAVNLEELFEKGFEITSTAQGNVIYSNDVHLIDSLKKQGYEFFRYFPYPEFVDLSAEAALNELEMNDGRIILEGSNHSLTYGPYDVLPKGKYNLNMNLCLCLDGEKSGEVPDNTVICKLHISFNYGENVLAVKDIMYKDFDSDGVASIDIPFELSGRQEGLEYLVYVEDPYRVEVGSIIKTSTPDYITLTSYNSHYKPIREVYYNLDGTRYTQSYGYSAVERTYNLADQVMSVRYLDDSDSQVLIRSGYSEIKYSYNEKGKVSKEFYFGPDGLPIMLKNGQYGIAKDYDPYGNEALIIYLGKDGLPVNILGGYAEAHREFDSRKRLIQEQYYDANGERTIQSGGYGGIEREYYDNGSIRLQRYYGMNNEPILNNQGYAEIRYYYNEIKQVIREEYYDTAGTRVMCSGGYSALNREYDDRGNVIAEYYLNTDDMPDINNQGYAILRREFDGARRPFRESYYDVYGNPASCLGGYYGMEREYDDAGNAVRLTYLSETGTPIKATTKIAIIERVYDKYSNLTEESYYDQQGAHVCNQSGIATICRTYNEHGQNIIEQYYGIDHLICVHNGGYSGVIRDYNEDGNVAVLAYIDDQGRIIKNHSGVASVIYSYDVHGKKTKEENFDAEGKRTVHSIGISAAKFSYNDSGACIQEDYYDVDDNRVRNQLGIAIVRRTVDERNRIVCEKYYDENMNPAINTNGYAGQIREYDSTGNLSAIYYTDANDNLVITSSGYAYTTRIYDELRNCIEERYYDPYGEPINLPGGYCMVHREYNDREVVETIRKDVAGNIVE